jgi:hypothetical protein
MLDIFSDRVIVLDPSGKYLRHVAFPSTGLSRTSLSIPRARFFSSTASSRWSMWRQDSKVSPLTQKLEGYVNFPRALPWITGDYLPCGPRMAAASLLSDRTAPFGARCDLWMEGRVPRYPAQLCVNDRAKFTWLIGKTAGSRYSLWSNENIGTFTKVVKRNQ